MTKKKKGGGMSAMRKKMKKIASTVGTVGLFAIPAGVIGMSIKRDIDSGVWPEFAAIQRTTGYYPPTNDWKWERLIPMIAGTAGGVGWKALWRYIGKKA